MGMPVILLPTQLLLVNLVTDGLPAIALGMEQPEPDAMRQPPRKPEEPFFSGGLLQRIVFRGLLIGVCTLGAFSMALRLGGTLEAARTTALCTLILSQLIHVFECKSETKSLFHLPLWNNWKPWLGCGFCWHLVCSGGKFGSTDDFHDCSAVAATFGLSLQFLRVRFRFARQFPSKSLQRKRVNDKNIGDSLAVDSYF